MFFVCDTDRWQSHGNNGSGAMTLDSCSVFSSGLLLSLSVTTMFLVVIGGSGVLFLRR